MIPHRFLKPTICLYFVLAIALSLGSWSIIGSECYREETRSTLSQTFEALVILNEAQLSIVRISSGVRLANNAREPPPAYYREIRAVIADIDRIQTLGYQRSGEIDLLLRTREIINSQILPITLSGKGYDRAPLYLDEVEQNLSHISSLATVHHRDIKDRSKVARATNRSWAVFAIVLILLATSGKLIEHHAALTKRHNEYVRSFALLHAHMTRSRVTALRLFLGHPNRPHPPAHDMLVAALNAVKELEDTNNRLVRMVNAQPAAPTEALGELLQTIHSRMDVNIQLEIGSEAQNLEVPGIQVHLIVEELVNNAVIAVEGKRDKQITIHARLLDRRFGFAHNLLIEVADSGSGMTSDILAKASTPFFSTRAGSHAGLGLTSCIEMVNSMRGTVKIVSTPGVGTVVRVLLPVDKGART
ncbi:sensor histidine kinase [Rhizobium sp. NLR9b]|uniref:sensor histidine kinase n=1 Tax=unclassified Rhizobium TaxID=2613769 RepID=UPI001C83A2E4|nr:MULTISPECIES: sensor histidine kinase [unclassified Rhizobium]MBX5230680.1 sensor histidine kinase [Rhizobium sp. NLR9b]MBX5291348.1 sensor histidine kinase [Rhizobium sp. NLR10b]